MSEKPTKRRRGKMPNLPSKRHLEVVWRVSELQKQLRTDEDYQVAIDLLRGELHLRRKVRAAAKYLAANPA